MPPLPVTTTTGGGDPVGERAPLSTTFDGPSLDPRLTWTVPRPPAAVPTPDGLRVVPFAGADLWARTATGAVANDGAALTATVDGARFDAAATVALRPARGWDQAGVLVRARRGAWWAKACVEAVPAACSAAGGGGGGAGTPLALVLATSVTRGGWTDQATQPLPPALAAAARGGVVSVALRAVREGASMAFYWGVPLAPDAQTHTKTETVSSSHDGVTWTRVRLAAFDPEGGGSPDAADAGADAGADVGVYALAPSAAGCVAVFRRLDVTVGDGPGDGSRL